MTQKAFLSPVPGAGGVTGTMSGNYDVAALLRQLPEASIPVVTLVPAFHLRRTGTDPAHARLLAEAARSAKLPPILVQKNGLRIIDGMHRVEVAKLRGEATVSACIVDCSDEEALVLAVKSNIAHGLPLSRVDRIASAERILAAHPDWSDRAVAGVAGLSAKAVASLRDDPKGATPIGTKRLGRDGKWHPVAAAEGRRRAAEYIQANPGASLRQVARETDVSLGTVHDVRERIRRGVDYATRVPLPSNPEIPHPAAVRKVAPHRPSLATRDISAASRPQSPPPTWLALSGKLANDPTLRYTEGGRAFLRWMTRHSLQCGEWREFAENIPQYWLEDIGRIAADIGEQWHQFAEWLQDKQDQVS